MVDVIGWCRALSRVVTIYKYHTQGAPPLSFLSCSHIAWNNLFTLKVFTDTVYLTSSTLCTALSTHILPCKFLSFSPRHTDMGLFAWISHFLFGVCIQSLVLVPSRHQTLALLKMRNGDRQEDAQRNVQLREWRMGRGDTNVLKVCVWGDSRAERVRTVEGKILTDDTVKTREKTT